MSYRSKVVWSEGLFLRPQHFQQQDRYLERYAQVRSVAMRSHTWGFSELRLDRDLLRLGKVAISSAQGVFPDGTPFSMPDDDQVPAPIEIDEKIRDQLFVGHIGEVLAQIAVNIFLVTQAFRLRPAGDYLPDQSIRHIAGATMGLF